MKGLIFILAMLWVTTTHAAANFTGEATNVARAEQARIDLGTFWTGKPLPNWSKPCPITIDTTERGTGGRTSYVFDRGEVIDWSMVVHGTRQEIADSVIPHEVNHTIIASLTRRPSPRWLDEGMATLFESSADHRRQREMANLYKRHPWNAFAKQDHTGDYPKDMVSVLALYSTGFTVVEWMLVQKDKDTLLAFVKDDLPPSQKWHRWYGMDAKQAEAAWLEWLKDRPTECSKCGCYMHSNTPVYVTSNQTPTTQQRPILYAVGTNDCIPCKPFANQYRRNAGFRADLAARVDVRFINGVTCGPWLATKGIYSWPSFLLCVQGRYYVTLGYSTKARLLGRIDSILAADRAANPPQAPAPATVTTDPTPNDPITIKQKEDSPFVEVETETEVVDPNQPIQTNPTTVTPANNEPKEKKSGIPWLGILIGAASATGVGIPAWALWAYRARKVAKGVYNHIQPPQQPVPQPQAPVQPQQLPPEQYHYITPQPQPPARHIIENDIVTVEGDKYQRAHAHAVAQVVKRYPGAQEMLAAEKSLITQFLAGDVSA